MPGCFSMTSPAPISVLFFSKQKACACWDVGRRRRRLLAYEGSRVFIVFTLLVAL